MSAPHPSYPDNEPLLSRALMAFGKRQSWPEEVAAKRAAQAVNGYPRDLDEPIESEVMHSDGTNPNIRTPPDTRPPSATEANHLDQLAELIRSLTYGEMIKLVDQLREAADGPEITDQNLANTFHKWSNSHD